RDYYEEVGISHETSVARSPQQNRVVERRNLALIPIEGYLISTNTQEMDGVIQPKIKKRKVKKSDAIKQRKTLTRKWKNTICKEKASNVLLKEREQYFEIQDLKAQLQDKNIDISELKKLIEKMKGKSVDTNFEKQSILGKPPLQPIRNQPVVRQPTAYKSERSQFPRHQFASQVGVSHDLTKPVTPHSWPQVRKSSFAKPYDVNASGPSRKSPKHVSF
nr:hypothetical protein [Tanacetum cinerariifolium]